MPCYPFKYGATTGIICTGREPVRKCGKCGRPSDYQCDYPLRKRDCDAHICKACSLHFQLDTNSLDYCHRHSPFVVPIGKHFAIVINKHSITEPRNEAVIVNVMRPTALGNPYKLLSEAPYFERRKCVQDYRKFLWDHLQKPDSAQSIFLDELVSHVERTDVWLQCVCAPRECHAQIIASAMRWKFQENHK